MSRIIIDNRSRHHDEKVLIFVREVIRYGFESRETIQGEMNVPKYCHVTTWKMEDGKKTIVFARPRRTKKSAYSFLVYDEDEKK